MSGALPDGLRRRLDDLWYEQYATYARAEPNGSAEERGGWRIARLGPRGAVYNVATPAPGASPSSSEPLEGAFAGVEDYHVWVDQADRGSTELLIAQGSEVVEELEAMWRPLPLPPAPAPPGYELLETDGSSAANPWRQWTDITAELRPAGDRRFFVARAGGADVAGGQLFGHGGVAGVYGLWTEAKHRGRGVGSALVSRMLAEALGADVATLQAGAPAVSLYRRLGFARYARYQVFRPAPAPDSGADTSSATT